MPQKITFFSRKTQEDLNREWDKIAPIRDSQVAAEADRSFNEVLEPWILNRLNSANTVLDAGCGTGRLTKSLRKLATAVTGIDPSEESVKIARRNDPTGTYEVSTIENWAASRHDPRFDLVVANMVLMDALHLDEVCASIATLARGGRLVATITHPAFWPIYWDYASAAEFNYSKELIVQAPFKTSSLDYSMNTTHIHRPLETYLETFRSSGLRLTRLDELRGPETVSTFPFPRFIGMEAVVEAR
ncbi:class I SAM-dependent methyltransferase [Brachybacterium sp. JHP9]|uniref:Class I SAM-dependent methyltransferase n=1 Tax=Brachybacterium equifaecis TaxID=2910770 RepID=A0ABT0R2R2_9MICO|nr:class I SAM-dependent methyltransferase [Brachybacterium equifaecis]MCL6424055.1 class I SAM-dependent methyltransferase [Brachybacterium equifaecis]